MSSDENLQIRIGGPADVDDVMELALSACEENSFLEAQPQYLLREIWAALNRDKGLVGIISKPNGKPEGAVLLRIGQMWYSDKEVLEEKAVFIHPDYRSAKGGRARRLVEFSKKIADALEIPLIIGVLSNNRTAAKVKLYERQLGSPAGAFFLYGARTGQHKVAEH